MTVRLARGGMARIASALVFGISYGCSRLSKRRQIEDGRAANRRELELGPQRRRQEPLDNSHVLGMHDRARRVIELSSGSDP